MATPYNPMSGNPFVNAVGSTKTTPVKAAPTPAVGTPFGQAGGNTGPITSTVSPQQAADNLARQVKGLQQSAPGIIKENTNATNANNTEADILQKQIDAMDSGSDPITQSVSQAFTSLNVPGYKVITNATKSLADAQFDIMISLMSRYNISNLAEAFGKIRKDYPDISSADAMDLLRYDSRYNADYTKRFSGNQIRAKNGFGMIDEKTYLEMEQGYSQLFKSYNLNTFDNTGQYEQLIGNNVDVVSAGKRISLAYDRVLHADKGTLDAWQQFYPQLSTSDLVATMLDPKNQLPIMERKVQAAEIGGAALSQGLNASLAQSTIMDNRTSGYSNVTGGTIGAETIANSGETLAGAKKDYQQIATELPIANKLSSIYGGQLAQYGQQESEKANILGMASEKRKLELLAAREQAGFQGTSGASKGAFSTQYLNRQSESGAF